MWWNGLDLPQLLAGLAVRIFIILGVLPVHELAHGYAAYKLGDDTAKKNGRLTLNPIAHMDWLGAASILLFGFGWAKPVPVNPYKFRDQQKRRQGMALTAFAGPLSNLLVAIIATFILRGFACSANTYDNLNMMNWAYYILSLIIFINIGLAIFNMIPVPPLDGSRILMAIFPENVGNYFERYGLLFAIILMIALKFFGGPLAFIQEKCFEGIYLGADWLYNLVGLAAHWEIV